MLGRSRRIYLATRKRRDQIFNTAVMRPLAAVVVAAVSRTPITPNQLTITNLLVFVIGAAVLVGGFGWQGGVIGALIIEFSYVLDCADGMLARHRGTASVEGHLFDFFTDHLKAVCLTGALTLHCWREGGWGPTGETWAAQTDLFLVVGIAGVVVIAWANALTSFKRRPEISGRAAAIAAHYETEEAENPPGLLTRAAGQGASFLRFLNHYPSHLWLFALLGALSAYLWIYITINLLYLGSGMLALVIRFGRPGAPK